MLKDCACDLELRHLRQRATWAAISAAAGTEGAQMGGHGGRQQREAQRAGNRGRHRGRQLREATERGSGGRHQHRQWPTETHTHRGACVGGEATLPAYRRDPYRCQTAGSRTRVRRAARQAPTNRLRRSGPRHAPAQARGECHPTVNTRGGEAHWGSLGLIGAHRGSSGLMGAHRGFSEPSQWTCSGARYCGRPTIEYRASSSPSRRRLWRKSTTTT